MQAKESQEGLKSHAVNETCTAVFVWHSGFKNFGTGADLESEKVTPATSGWQCTAEVGPDPDYRSQLRQNSAFFLRTRVRSQKFGKNRTRCQLSISAVAGVCVVISLVKTWVIWGWIDECTWNLNRSRILKIEKLPDPDSKILGQEQSLKKWLRPPLVHSRDDRIVVFYYPILSCFWKMLSVSDPNPVLVKIILSVSENYPKVYHDAQHIFLCFVYFVSWGKITPK